MSEPIVGVMGGSGLYKMEGLTEMETIPVSTPFGEPSDAVVSGLYHNVRLLFLPRHGVGHRYLPHEINYRANIYALKKLGARHVISVSAVGSMKEKIAPGHIVIPDQFIDRTKQRVSTFFGQGVAAHVQFGDPLCGDLTRLLYESAVEVGATAHQGGTYLCIDGPQFSTRAESLLYRQWGVDIIGMTNVTEAKLAREAELCYATIALSTDYDCWHDEEVSVEAVLQIIQQNVSTAQKIIKAAARHISPDKRPCSCASALQNAVMTRPDLIPVETRKKLDLLLGRYLS